MPRKLPRCLVLRLEIFKTLFLSYPTCNGEKRNLVSEIKYKKREG